LREEHRLRVFESKVLRIFGPKREEDGSWRKFHNDELYGLYSEVRGTCSSHEGGEKCSGVLLGGPKGRDHWEDLDVGGRVTLRCTLGR
jgi:hypothetical protein